MDPLELFLRAMNDDQLCGCMLISIVKGLELPPEEIRKLLQHLTDAYPEHMLRSVTLLLGSAADPTLTRRFVELHLRETRLLVSHNDDPPDS